MHRSHLDTKRLAVLFCITLFCVGLLSPKRIRLTDWLFSTIRFLALHSSNFSRVFLAGDLNSLASSLFHGKWSCNKFALKNAYPDDNYVIVVERWDARRAPIKTTEIFLIFLWRNWSDFCASLSNIAWMRQPSMCRTEMHFEFSIHGERAKFQFQPNLFWFLCDAAHSKCPNCDSANIFGFIVRCESRKQRIFFLFHFCVIRVNWFPSLTTRVDVVPCSHFSLRT